MSLKEAKDLLRGWDISDPKTWENDYYPLFLPDGTVNLIWLSDLEEAQRIVDAHEAKESK